MGRNVVLPSSHLSRHGRASILIHAGSLIYPYSLQNILLASLVHVVSDPSRSPACVFMFCIHVRVSLAYDRAFSQYTCSCFGIFMAQATYYWFTYEDDSHAMRYYVFCIWYGCVVYPLFYAKHRFARIAENIHTALGIELLYTYFVSFFSQSSKVGSLGWYVSFLPIFITCCMRD